ncbi:MAG: hypothetical protein GY719_09960 [bacterium]|nr:hypothetical protein [bacterium]
MDGTLSLKQILSRLAGHAAVLQGRGVLHAAIFGSVARGEARADSDVDVLVELDSNAGLTLLDYVAVKNLADRGGWHPGIRVNGFKANR